MKMPELKTLPTQEELDALRAQVEQLQQDLSAEQEMVSNYHDTNSALAAQVEQLRTSNGKKFTAALNVLDTGYHITLCFADCVKASKVSTSSQSGEATVIDVVYWKHCDLTVALVSSDFCNERAKYWAKNGYGYTLGYNPHFTLGKGDCTSIYKCMVGKTYQVGGEYCRVFDVGIDATPAQCLAEIKAQAIEALNTKELYLLIKTYGSKDCAYRVQEYLESKTSKLRQQAKEPNWDEINNKLDLARQAKAGE